MWDPRRLTTLWASTACYRDSFTFFFLSLTTCKNATVEPIYSYNDVTFVETAPGSLTAVMSGGGGGVHVICVDIQTYSELTLMQWELTYGENEIRV
jgi:hypothetical protein